MKKFLVSTLIICSLVTLVGCGGKEKETNSKDKAEESVVADNDKSPESSQASKEEVATETNKTKDENDINSSDVKAFNQLKDSQVENAVLYDENTHGKNELIKQTYEFLNDFWKNGDKAFESREFYQLNFGSEPLLGSLSDEKKEKFISSRDYFFEQSQGKSIKGINVEKIEYSIVPNNTESMQIYLHYNVVSDDGTEYSVISTGVPIVKVIVDEGVVKFIL